LAPISTVIVAYQSGEFLHRCLAAVGSGHGELVVLDNGSPDPGGLPDGLGDIRLIRRPRNDGFGSAANEGVAATAGRWVLLLNPDAWPIDDGIERLVEFAESRPGLGATGPLLFDEDGQPQRSTIRPPLGAASLAIWAAFPKAVTRAYAVWRRVTGALGRGRMRPDEFLQGSALLVRRDAFERIGGFDENFFMYGEDADLCARLRDAGWGVELCRAARFVHVGGGSSRSEPADMHVELLRSWLRLIAKLRGTREAERARRWLLRAMRARGWASREPRYRNLASWLGSGRVGELLGLPE
jgi:GT2 family glycosyltransferase